MKILVLSDSHSGLSYMRRCIEAVKPHRIIHLGDYYDDACAMAEEYPDIPIIQLPGNCDRYRCPPFVQEVLAEKIDGVYFFMTHGHRHMVKQRLDMLLRDPCIAKHEYSESCQAWMPPFSKQCLLEASNWQPDFL